MSKNGLSRRDFLKISGTSAALAAAGLPFSRIPYRITAQGGTTEITFMGWGMQVEDQGVRAAVDVFEKANPSIKVTWIQEPGQSTDQFTATFLSNVAAGTPPDTAFVDSTNYESFAAKGLLMDITDRIKNDPDLGAKDYFNQPQESARSADDQGHWHGIGACWVAPHLYYNADLLAKAGINPPGFKDNEIWDWNTFIANAQKLTVDANGKHPTDSGFDTNNVVQWGVQWPFSNWTFIASAVVANGGDYTAKGKSGLDSPAAIEAIQNVADLIFKYHVAPQDATLTGLGMTNTQMLAAGKLALAVDGSWALSWMNPTTVTSAKMGTGALPAMKQPGSYIQSHFHAALASTKFPDAAWQWIKFLNTPFYQLQFIKSGLWLPSQSSLSTADGITSWNTKPIHPDNYVDLVTTYMPKHGVTSRIPPGYASAFTKFINPAFQAVNNGQAAADVMPAAVKQTNDAIAAAVATPSS